MCIQTEQTFPVECLFRSYFPIIPAYFRLDGANQQWRVFSAWKAGRKRAWRTMLTYLTKGLFSARCCLGEPAPPLCSKSAPHYQSSRLWEAAATHRAQWAPLSAYRWLWRGPWWKIRLNKILWKILSLSGLWQKKAGLPCHLQRLAPLSLLPIIRHNKWPSLQAWIFKITFA